MSKPTILYVDDDNENIILFKILFKSSFEILTAASGNEGLEILSENKHIKAIISDMKMPGMDGLKFLAAAKHINDVPCFLLTGFEEIDGGIEEGLLAGKFNKPFDTEKILSSLKKVMLN